MAQKHWESTTKTRFALRQAHDVIASAATMGSNYDIDGFNVAGLFSSRVRQNGWFKAVAQYSAYELAQRAFILTATFGSVYAVNQMLSRPGLWGFSVNVAVAFTAFTLSHVLVMLETLFRRHKLHEKITTKQRQCVTYALMHKDIQGADAFAGLLESLREYQPVLRRKGDMLAFLDKKRRLYEYIISGFNKSEPAEAMRTLLSCYERYDMNIERLLDEAAILDASKETVGFNSSL